MTGAGLFMLPTAAVQLLLGPPSGLLHRWLSLRAQLIAGQLSCAAGFAGLALWHDAPWQVYAATSVLGVGFWLCLVALPNQVVAAVPAARTGSATAVNTVVRNAGGAPRRAAGGGDHRVLGGGVGRRRAGRVGLHRRR